MDPGRVSWDPETGETWYEEEVVDVHFNVDGFACPHCGLTLDGHAEVGVPELPTEFVEQRTRVPVDEPDYGND